MCMPINPENDHIKMMRAHINSQMNRLTGETDSSGIELHALIRLLSNLYEMIESQNAGESVLSGPRWGLLLRLLAEEERGNCDGITPTSLSHFQNVSKNTISALLRGLEEQGLIQRALDPEDHRLFRIQLTQAGRELVKTTAPTRMRAMNHTADGLSATERAELLALLEKLHNSMMVQFKNL